MVNTIQHKVFLKIKYRILRFQITQILKQSIPLMTSFVFKKMIFFYKLRKIYMTLFNFGPKLCYDLLKRWLTPLDAV